MFLKLLLQHNAEVNQENNNGTTALSFAAQYNQIEVVKTLLNHKADQSIKDHNHKTALDYAREKKFEAIVNILN